jgi:hypothetical protein
VPLILMSGQGGAARGVLRAVLREPVHARDSDRGGGGKSERPRALVSQQPHHLAPMVPPAPNCGDVLPPTPPELAQLLRQLCAFREAIRCDA